ncbi:MAG: molybdenum cofactor guanylyltransferase [Alphaproteobacteria bacterium]|nr:molybdenum cofactor guanylyltransferase [Alphaproteobacteria bacterium]
MRIVGAVIAGGNASRIGGEKAFLSFSGSTLIDAVIKRFAPQVEDLALNLRADRHPVEYHGTVLRDDEHGIGPLAGIIACLAWATDRGATFLATVPCDTPFLPADLVCQLARAAKPDQSVYAGNERHHYLCALWPTSALEKLRVQARAHHRLSDVHSVLGGRCVAVKSAPHAFFNINSREDLRIAESIFSKECARDE